MSDQNQDASNQAFLQEIEEEIKQEKLEKFWKEYGSYLIAGAVLAVLFTGLISSYRAWSEKTNQAATSALVMAMEGEDKADKLAALTGELNAGHKAMAYLTAASLYLREDKPEEARLEYWKAARDADVPGMYRDLARYLAVRMSWDAASEDADQSTDELLNELKMIWSKGGSPWRHHARVQAALIAAEDLQDYEQAKAHLSEVLTNEEVPVALKQKAQALNHIYTLRTSSADNTPTTQPAINEEPEG